MEYSKEDLIEAKSKILKEKISIRKKGIESGTSNLKSLKMEQKQRFFY